MTVIKTPKLFKKLIIFNNFKYLPPCKSPMSKSLIESIVFRLFFICMALDFVFHPHPHTPTPETSSPDPPISYSNPTEPSNEENYHNYRHTQINIIEILYCISWSYKNNFQQVKDIIQNEYPDLDVIGGEYPPTPLNKLLSRVCSGIQIGFFAMMIAGDRIFQGLGMQEPGFYRYMKERKMIAFFFIFIIGNNLSNQFWSTGAFEITFRDQTVFSKLQLGRMPYLQEILERIKEIKGY